MAVRAWRLVAGGHHEFDINLSLVCQRACSHLRVHDRLLYDYLTASSSTRLVTCGQVRIHPGSLRTTASLCRSQGHCQQVTTAPLVYRRYTYPACMQQMAGFCSINRTTRANELSSSPTYSRSDATPRRGECGVPLTRPSQHGWCCSCGCTECLSTSLQRHAARRHDSKDYLRDSISINTSTE